MRIQRYLVIGILVLLALSLFVGKHYKHQKDSSIHAQLVTPDKKRDLSAAEIETINRQVVSMTDAESNQKLPQTIPSDVRNNFKTLNDVQKINKFNRK